jgi:hypothetical protein
MLVRVALAVGCLLAPISAQAADLTVDCRVKQTDLNGSQTTYNKRFEFSWEVKGATILEDKGSGWSIVSTGPYIGADDSRIIVGVDENNQPKSYIDRRTGTYYYKASDEDGGAVYRGTCHKAGFPPGRF